MIHSAPTIVTIRNPHGQSGFKCCWCRCCMCVNLQFLRTEPGVVKIAEVVLGFFCQTLAYNFGAPYSSSLGTSYQSFLSTASWSLTTTFLLLFCYIFSERSFGLIRQSLFETAFNCIAAFSYITSGSYLGYVVHTILYPIYQLPPYSQAYQAMSAVYILGTITGLVYAYDAWKAWQVFRSFR